ncbi:hypothetical protein FB567DRAFT_466528 [Paraphoma chrysanthemicola]|uniref:Uncharacterized protein n=1 Tax=Paraphoma chrysanthemicola TaxID=798071 RepID=A0A8K0RB17_9PLEO|nr:hypothetical protein FB567DRAFT_466528 [Paraphoma chrysanthemicola]
MAISKLQAQLAAATNEVTVAAANLIFNFTLVKYEAPKEYQGLGKVLSAKRKDNTEHGSSHITARQLGALFEGVCPTTPNLLEAYGTRASEIAKASKRNSEPCIKTFFSEYTGIDGTSIWAAATSSNSALHVHLLACMLARLWTAPEAVSIWAELISERRIEIAHKVEEDGVKFSLAAAAGQEIARSQLATWDASARAWLLTADAVHCRQQKQLELILKNIDLPINGDSKVLSSVVSAWSSALETMEKVVLGMPQEIWTGATLLGLSAWHLYPDMSVFGRKIVSIKMSDSLIPRGGMLSLGHSGKPHDTGDENGVYWSLSLAHLRHYGRPIHAERAMSCSSRISFSELSLVAFAALLEEWHFNETQCALAATAVVCMAECVGDYLRTTRQGERTDLRLFQMLKEGASTIVHRSADDEDLNRKLIQLGRREARTFFGETKRTVILSYTTRFFGFLDSTFFVQSLKDCDARILFLRRKAIQLSASSPHEDSFVIRYKHDIFKNVTDVLDTTPGDAESIGDQDNTLCQELASDVTSKNTRASKRRKQGGSTGRKENKKVCKETKASSKAGLNVSDIPAQTNCQDEFPQSVNDSSSYSFATAHLFSSAKELHRRWLPRCLRNALLPQDESVTLDAQEQFKSWDDCVQVASNDLWGAEISFTYVLGDTSNASLYVRTTPGSQFLYDQTVTLEDFQWCMERRLFSPSAFLQCLTCNKSLSKDGDRLRKTVTLLASAALVYDDLTDVTIDVGILSRPLIESQWARYFEDGIVTDLRENKSPGILSLVAYFETGIYDVDPDKLKEAFALSYTNSLFVFSSMIQDPYESRRQKLSMRRILGNIGRPGITFLLPPQEPMVRELDPSSWMVDSYRSFDGRPARSFETTSVHLSFTDYHVQMYDGSRGSHDNQVSFLESVISVRDKGEWVADIDPLPLLKHDGIKSPSPEKGPYYSAGVFRVLEPQRDCQHLRIASRAIVLLLLIVGTK